MKILYIITQADGGGAQHYVLRLAQYFGGSIAAGTEAQELFDSAHNKQITAYQLRHLKRNINWHDLPAIFEIYNLVKKLKPDIIHLNSSKAGFVGSIGGKLAGAKVVFTAHGFRYNEPLSRPARLFYLLLEKFASYFRDYTIAVSEADRNSALQHHLVAAEKISTIHNGLSATAFLSRAAARQALNLPPDAYIFGTVAHFYPTKGLDTLITAVSQVKPFLAANCRFVLIGDGPEFKNCVAQITLLGLNDLFFLPGKISEAQVYLKAFDGFILPSRKEGFPYAILGSPASRIADYRHQCWRHKRSFGRCRTIGAKW